MPKKFLILMGSPRLHGNTAELLKPFTAEIGECGGIYDYIPLAGKKISPCLGCYACQNVEGEYGCVQQDDMQEIVKSIIESDCIVFATPIYTWYCPTEMKALLDRHYGLNKFYGSASGSLWKGKEVAIIATHGYDREYGAEPFETGIRRLCEHSGLRYRGMYSARDLDNLASFRTEDAVLGARTFARELMEA
jgi:multimeric flavodoxin WrbA